MERRFKVPLDQRSHLLCLQVVGIIVTRAQDERSQHDPSLDLGAETGISGLPVHAGKISLSGNPQAVTHPVKAGQIGAGFRHGNYVVGSNGVIRVG